MADLNEQHSFTTGQTNDEMLRDSSLIADGNKDDSQMLAKEGQNTTNWLQNGNVLPDQFDRKSKFIDRKPAGSDEIVEQTDTVSDKAFDDKASTDLSASTVVNPSSERRENRMQNTYSSDIDVINEVSGDTGYSLSTQRALAKSSGEHVIQKSYTKPNNILKMTKNLWMSAEYDNIPDLGEHQITLNTGTDDKSGDVGDGSDEDDDDDDMNSEMSYERSDLLEDLMTTQPKPTSFFKIFQFADCLDYILMLTGLIGALGMGTLIPVNFVVYGRVLDLMIASVVTKQQNMTLHRDLPMNSTVIFDEIQNNVIWFCIIGCAVIGLAFAEMSLWLWTSERQTHRMRQAAFWAILNKHQGWFDCHHVGELTSRLNDDILAVQVGLGDKFAKTLEWTATFMAGYIIGFIEGWKLTLVILAVLPLLGIVVALFTKIIRKYSQAETESYAKAGAISEEVFAAINTVVAFGGEEKETDRYSNNLESARLIAIKKGLLSGVVQGIMWFIIFSSFGLAFWYGSKLVADGEYTGGQVLQIFLGMLVGTTSIGHVIPYLETLSVARGAAANVFNIIEQKSELDSSSTEGTYLEKVSGTVQFSDVVFSYPTRKSVKILNGLSFTLSAGQIMAVVGSSGCGKSTIIQLIQRFYDPDEGKITLDGVNLKDLNLKWLRNQVGVVSQQPVLFSTTISENIRMGKLDLTQAEVENAAKQANVHQFIISLPKKYDTLIGEQGSQLSGGQKQRIAIARALVRNPKILLLDEATSALDTQSESIVQQALNEVSKGRTTLIIAHRLSTIKSADIIIGLEHGQVIEKGSHDELISFSGLYSNLVKKQWSLSREMSADSLDLQDVIINEMPLAEKRARLQRQRTINRLDSTTISYHRITSKDGSVRLNYYRSPSVLTVKQDREDDKLSAPPMKRILNLNSSETAKLIMGCVGAMLMGGSIPVFSVVLSDVLGNFATNDKNALMEDAVFLAYMFVIIGVVCAFGVWAQNYFFAASGANLTMKIRKMVFAAILKQETGWFDDPQNNVGSLCSRLSNDAAQIQGAAGQQFGMLLQAITNMGTAIIIAVVYGPKLSGVIFVFIPLMFAAGIVQGKMVQDNTKGSLHDLDESAQVASEAIDNIRTVASLTREQYFQQKYESKLHTMYIKVRKNSFIFGAFYAVSQSIIFFSYAATFSYGGVLIERGEMEFHIVFRVFACLIFGSMSLGRALSWMPDYNKAKVAAAKIFYLLDREPKINRTGVKELTPETCGGHITLHNIVFSYPSRPDLPVLHNLSLSVLPGQTVAIVGTSGSGKSTIIKLLERFYEPSAGYVNIDNYDLSSLSLVWLRSQMGLVAQEPVLFDLTIRENIAYGDNSRDIQMDEIIAAARLANIHSFIESLPLGYETNVGGKGMQLSGGQKQRIAIARALIRNPKILLLDEATSALDNESEKLIQEALDKARQDRTTVVIAHRLTTVKHADVIVVIHNGVVVEEGTHKWLMHQRGFYYGLHRAQKCLKHSWKRKKNDVN